MKTIETERLILNLSSLSDVEFYLELYNSPKFIEYNGDRNLRTLEQTEDYIKERFLPYIEQNGFGNYTVELKDGGKKIGSVGIFVREGIPIPDIGFSFLDDFIGKGYAYEAAKKLLEVGRSTFGLKNISALTTDENLASQKLIERLGLKFIRYSDFPGSDVQLRYYEI